MIQAGISSYHFIVTTSARAQPPIRVGVRLYMRDWNSVWLFVHVIRQDLVMEWWIHSKMTNIINHPGHQVMSTCHVTFLLSFKQNWMFIYGWYKLGVKHLLPGQLVQYNYTSRSRNPTKITIFPICTQQLLFDVWANTQAKLRDSDIIYQILIWDKVAHNNITPQVAASCCVSLHRQWHSTSTVSWCYTVSSH